MRSPNKYGANFTIFLFLFVPIIISILFLVYPATQLINYSLTDWDGLSDTFKYIGLQNYIDIFTKEGMAWHSLLVNFMYFMGHIIFICFDLIVAAIIFSKIKGANFFKSVIFMPYVLNGTAIAYVFSYFFSSENGTFNSILQYIGFSGFIYNWLSDEKVINIVLASVHIYKYTGINFLLLLAAMQSIPNELYESAKVDGANFFQKFIYITIPGVSTIFKIVLFTNLSGALMTFDVPFIMTGGGPSDISSTFAVYIVNTAFKYNNLALASSMGVILAMIIVVLSVVQNQLFRYAGERGKE